MRRTKHIVLLDPLPADLNWDVWTRIAERTPSATSKGQSTVCSTAHRALASTFDKIARYFRITILTSDSDKLSSTPDYGLMTRTLRRNLSTVISDPIETKHIWTWLERQKDDLNVDSHERNLALHLPGTGEWLFQEPKFRKWASLDKTSPVIWLVGPEGCGKSILCSLAIERMRQNPQEQAVIHLMIAVDKPRSEYHLVTQLAVQLLAYVIKYQGGIDAEALLMLPREHVNDKKTSQVKGLLQVLISQCPAIYVFIDGLDEAGCTEADDRQEPIQAALGTPEHSLHSVISFFARTPEEQQGTPVSLWCSSRQTRTISAKMQGLGAIELPIDKLAVAVDIAQFVEHASKNSPMSSRRMIKLAQNNFLLASMVADERGYSSFAAHDFEEDTGRDPPESIRMLYQHRIDQILSSTSNDTTQKDSLHPW